MKARIALLFLLGFFWSSANGQDLTLDQLIGVQKMGSLDKVNDYLLQRAWQFDGAEPENGFTQVVWAFKVHSSSVGNAATLNVFFCESCEEGVSTILYRTYEKRYIDLIRKSAINYKMEATTKVGTEAISTIYRGATYELRIIIEKAESGHRPAYDVELNKIQVMDASPR